MTMNTGSSLRDAGFTRWQQPIAAIGRIRLSCRLSLVCGMPRLRRPHDPVRPRQPAAQRRRDWRHDPTALGAGHDRLAINLDEFTNRVNVKALVADGQDERSRLSDIDLAGRGNPL